MKKLLATAATAAILVTGPVLAQETDWQGIQDSHTMLEEQVQTELARLGIDMNAGDLTLDQISQAFLIFQDQGLTDEQRTEQLEQMLAAN